VTPASIDIATARAELGARGFSKLSGVLTPADMVDAEAMLDTLVEASLRSPEPSWRSLFAAQTSNEPSHPEVNRPLLLNTALRRTPVFLRCQHLAAHLLGGRAHYLFDHAIYKRPSSETSVHWHQDQAYLGPTLSIRSLHFWIPFQDVDRDSGCLRFVPGSHSGVVWPHSPAYEAHPHILRADIAEPADVVDQPLGLGDIGVHTNFTLHGSGPNRTSRVRKAWIIHFGDRPRWFKHLLRAGARISSRTPDGGPRA
jgi:hypothetical protein